ncbi:MAG: CocE/NonD family hydrolase, partial [Candidatus Acidiferrales bacterium]
GSGCVFTQPTTESPCKPFDRGTNDGYDFYMRLGPLRNANEKYFTNSMPFWDEMMKRDTNDAWWQARNIRAHLKNIKPAVMTVGGWFDAENLFGALEVYRAVERLSPGANNILVMGPWVHGGWARGDGDSLGDARFDTKTSEFYREQIELAFFNQHLKEWSGISLPEAFVFETGVNQWRRFDVWPPKGVQAKSLYLHAGSKLSFEPPAENAEAFDEYVSDPKKPVPLTPGIATGMARRYLVDDQRHAARRPDVLVYVSDVLEDDVTVAGPIVPSLHISTTGTDQDFIVKLIDVYPDRFPDEKGEVNNTLGGYQQLVRGEVMRGKFRNSLEKPEPFTPGAPTKVEFEVSDTFHTFRRGHRIMVQIHSTWFPLFDINPGKFMNIFQATEADFQKTTQRVYRSRSMPSALRVGILPAK